MAASRREQLGLRYEDCSLSELKNFFENRTGVYPSTIINSHQQLSESSIHRIFVASLQALDDATTFDFQGLPTEIRLLVYHILLERSDPDEGKELHPQILATSKAINREASPELYAKTNIRLTIDAEAVKSHDWITETIFHIGKRRALLLKSGSTLSGHTIYNTLSRSVGNIQNITLQVNLRANRSKHLLRSRLPAEQFNQIHQILAALAALWNISGALQTLKIEFLDDTSDCSPPTSPPVHISLPRSMQMDVGELKRLFHPLSGIGGIVIVVGSALPLAVMEHITTGRDDRAVHPFAAYAAIMPRAEGIVAKVRTVELCCKQATPVGDKPCGICRLEKKLAIARQEVVACRIASGRSERNLAMDLEEVGRFLQSSKVLGLVTKAEAKEEVSLFFGDEQGAGFDGEG